MIPNGVLRFNLQRLEGCLRDLGRISVAWSGGVDSTLLLLLAHRLLPSGRVTALHAHTTLHTADELLHVKRLADEFNIALRVVEEDPLAWPDFTVNTGDRCYICKKRLYSRFSELVRGDGLGFLLDGTNADDLGEDRPGLVAVGELGVRTPLADCGLDKEAVRQLSAQLGLSTWNRPANSCLATRIPHGISIDREKVTRVAAAEAVLRAAGFGSFRVRIVGDWALVELRDEATGKGRRQGLPEEVKRELRRLGFERIYLQLDSP